MNSRVFYQEILEPGVKSLLVKPLSLPSHPLIDPPLDDSPYMWWSPATILAAAFFQDLGESRQWGVLLTWGISNLAG